MVEEEPDAAATYPMREIFVGCCASVDEHSAKRMAQTATERLLFIDFPETFCIRSVTTVI
jgi:hypothetical protein